jgi:hypothetical protein
VVATSSHSAHQLCDILISAVSYSPEIIHYYGIAFEQVLEASIRRDLTIVALKALAGSDQRKTILRHSAKHPRNLNFCDAEATAAILGNP